MCHIAFGMANSSGPDQTAPKEQSDQGQSCLPRRCHLNILGYSCIMTNAGSDVTKLENKYGNSITIDQVNSIE